MWRGSTWLVAGRDIICLGLGVWGVIHEELSGKADLGRLAFFAVLMIAPGVLATRWLTMQSGTVGPGSSSDVSVEPSPSSTPSSGTST